MGIADTEQEILKELSELENVEPEERPTEELMEEIQQEIKPEETEVEEEDEEPEDDGEDIEEFEEEEEPEEKLTGAKFRHKLKAEREKREEVERRLRDFEIAAARAEGARDAAPEVEAPVEEIPDEEYEPEKYAKYRFDKQDKEMQAMRDDNARLNAERQWENMQTSYAKGKPEYTEAKEYLYKTESDKIKGMYPNATESQIAEHLKQQEHSLVAQSSKAGMDPLQQIEFLAYQSGYRPGEVKKDAPKKKANIKAIKKNAKKNASLIGGSGAGDSGDAKTANQLAAMGMDEILKFGRGKYEAAIRKIDARS